MSCLRPNPPDCFAKPNCIGPDNCPQGVCPDFQIKRNDTLPPFRVNIEDENGPIDLTNLVLEASMWANAKLKKDITNTDTFIAFADNIGFDQALQDDIIIVDQSHSTEHMKILGFDDVNKLVEVQRGIDGTIALAWKKGTKLRIFRFINSAATTEMTFEDVEQVDGTTLCNQLENSFLIYEFNSKDTCSPGCFLFEFKLIQMFSNIPSIVPSTIPLCSPGFGVENVRKFPLCGDFLIKICNSPTTEF